VISKQLVLIGGGHSHAIALHLWQKNLLPNTEITLISDVKQTPYSGMLPGYVAGHYTFAQTHIDLVKLAKKNHIKLIIESVINIDTDYKKVVCQSGKTVNYDLLSIDIGSTPDDSLIKGAKENAIPAKPVPLFLEKWQQIVNYSQQKPQEKIIINIIGGGAGGVELALNMHQKLKAILKQKKLIINLINRGNKILDSHNNYVSQKLTKILTQKNINLYLQQEVREIHQNSIITKSGLILESNYTFLVTNSSPARWLKTTNISTDDQGFILVKDTLQTLSHRDIFATGDIATMVNYPRPKAGVFAVRQGKPLYENWCQLLRDKSPRNYQPQSLYLSLIGTGDKKAVASWGILGAYSPLFWLLKDYIDKKFMRQFD